jgi:hypothetical protein
MDVGVRSSNDMYDRAGGLVTLGVLQNRRRKVVILVYTILVSYPTLSGSSVTLISQVSTTVMLVL